MIYKLLKGYINFLLFFYCKKIAINQPLSLQTKGPLLLIANHPNSFFDAIVIGALFKQPVYFLARGDAFTKPFHRKLLQLINAIPIYRLSEGKENLHLNDVAFNEVNKLWEQHKIVLIFIEGICKLTHQLQPFKKGAARMVYAAWQQNMPVQILPIALVYSSFTKTPFIINLTIGSITGKTDYNIQQSLPNFCNDFNTQLKNSLQPLIQLPEQKKENDIAQKLLYVLHFPLFLLAMPLVKIKTKNTVFYHSILFGILVILVPIYWMLILAICFSIIY